VTAEPDDFSILLVCRANLCRSPMAEFLLRRYVEVHQLPVTVSSAGTHAEPGMQMHPHARQALASMGIEASGFTSRRLDDELMGRVDLVLTMTDAQRSWVVNAFPQAMRRTYLLSQFSRLVGATSAAGPIEPVEWGPDLLRRAVEGRGLIQPLIEGRDIEDPIGRQVRQFQNCARLIGQRFEPLFAGVPLKTGR
jgi:protein-tyrosine phosphatase